MAGVRAPGGQPARGDPRAARRAARGPARRSRSLNSALPAIRGVRTRRAAGRALLEGDARRADPVHRAGAPADVRARAARASRATARRPCPPRAAEPAARRRTLRAEPRAVLLPEQRAAAVLEDADPRPGLRLATGEPWYEQSPRAFVGLAGESRIADANSPMFRVQAGGGPTTLVSTPRRWPASSLRPGARAARRRPPGRARRAPGVPARRAVRDAGAART